MTLNEFVEGFTAILLSSDVTDKEKRLRLQHLNMLMRYASVFPWDAVLKFHGAFLQDIEYGRRSWDSDGTDLKELYLYPRASEKKQGRASRANKNNDDSVQYCWAWQDGKCNDKSCKYSHICSACFKYRNQRVDHPKSKCPYNDPTYREDKNRKSKSGQVFKDEKDKYSFVSVHESCNFTSVAIQCNIVGQDSSFHAPTTFLDTTVQTFNCVTLCSKSTQTEGRSIDLCAGTILSGINDSFCNKIQHPLPCHQYSPSTSQHSQLYEGITDHTTISKFAQKCNDCLSEVRPCTCSLPESIVPRLEEPHFDNASYHLTHSLNSGEGPNDAPPKVSNVDRAFESQSSTLRPEAKAFVPFSHSRGPALSDDFPEIRSRDLHSRVCSSGIPNFRGLRIPVKSNLQIPIWRAKLQDYND
ncbi:uncharacterized protein [Ptychodera flava]|uniref:uncharacterized protein n=1 Tax=Ptychodera flava TaxID=63121 RepID=UPI00396A66BD